MILGVLLLLSSLPSGTGIAQTRTDLEMLRQLANQQKQQTILDAESIEPAEEIGPTLTEIELPGEELKDSYFGYSFFKAPASISLLNNLPAPSDYVLGPGDEIVITLWGETELVSTHEISRSNTIYVERVGLLNLSGKSLGEAEIFLKGRLEKAYSTLRGPRPRTFMDISLGKLKSINVRFVGQVQVPGLYPVHPFSSVTTGLMQAGGVDKTGSLREIQVIRNGEVITEVDLYAFLLEGKTDGDIRLRDQDVVLVPIRESAVSISGEVRNPGIYELLQSESLADLVSFSGNFTARARSPIELLRIKPLALRTSEDTPRETYFIPVSGLNEWQSLDGDSIIVHSILPEERKISIRGQVKNPGIYTFTDSLYLLDALKLAGGIEDPSFWPTIYGERGEILRKNLQGDHAIIIPFNVTALVAGDADQNKVLMNNDVVILRRAQFFHSADQVSIQGEVQIPGVYSIQENDETLESIIARAGGFTDRAFPEGLLVLRDNKRLVLTDYQIPVFEGDEITVPRRSGTVEVLGEVHNPALIRYEEGLSVWDYIESAGGLTDYASKHNISVIYPNGDIKVRTWLRTPKVREGSLVMVHREPETTPLDMTSFLKEAASIAASLATIFFILTR